MSTENPQTYPQVFKYDETFKMTVVAEVLSGQISRVEASRKYKLGHDTVRKWLAKYHKCGELKKYPKVQMANKPSSKTLQDKNRQLAVLYAEAQLEIKALKKLIELADKEFNTSLKKNFGPKVYQSLTKREK